METSSSKALGTSLKELAKSIGISKNKGRQCKTYQVVGVSFEGHQEILTDFYKNEYKIDGHYDVELVLENDNKYDENAISVALYHNGKYAIVGYISRQENAELRGLFHRVEKSSISSMGICSNGNVGFSICVEFCDEDE